MIDLNTIVAAFALWSFFCALAGYVVGRIEGRSIAAGEPTETGVNGL